MAKEQTVTNNTKKNSNRSTYINKNTKKKTNLKPFILEMAK